MTYPRLFESRVAIVTGAGQGLGASFARALALSGCAVAALDVNADRVDALAAQLQAQGAVCKGFTADVRSEESCGKAVSSVREHFGAVAVLVNNAGVSTRAQLEDPGFNDEIDRVMSVNLKGVLNMTRACLEDLKETKGAIVNIASIAALLASFASIPYAASKGAVAQATKFLARDLAPFDIRVNALAPGFVVTPLTADLRSGADSRMQRSAARTLLKRVAEPEDLIGPLLFLASDLSRYVTGLVLPVDGGYSAN